MPIILLFIALLTPFSALGMNCWIADGANINFGNLVAGDTASTNASVKFSCQADYGTTQYISVCLSSVETPPFKMASVGDENGKQYTLLFRLFNAFDRSQELNTPSGGNLLSQTVVAASNASVSGSFPLTALIPAGQSQLPVRSYFKYNMDLRLSWNSATRQDTLKSCQDGTASGETVQGSSRAEATLADGCFIQQVTALNFGTLTSTTAFRAVSSTATIRARCPAGTAFSLGLGVGSHASGSQRQICNDRAQCLRYGLWQDAGASLPWGDRAGADALNVTNPQGGVQNFTVYGVVPSQPLSGTGEFSDDVIVTLTY